MSLSGLLGNVEVKLRTKTACQRSRQIEVTTITHRAVESTEYRTLTNVAAVAEPFEEPHNDSAGYDVIEAKRAVGPFSLHNRRHGGCHPD